MNTPKFCSLALLIATVSASAAPSGRLLVANKAEHTLSIIDPSSGSTTAVIAEDGITGHEVIASPNGRMAFVPIYGNSGVGSPGTDGRILRIIDLRRGAIAGTIDFGHGVRPHCAMIGPRDGLLYITTELDNAVTIIDPKSRAIVGKIPTGRPESHMLAISPDGSRGYTANVASGTVSVLDLAARKLISVIPVADMVQRISVSGDGLWVFTADQRQPRLAVIDTAAGRVRSFIRLPATAYGTACTRDGRWLVAALPSIRKIALVDLRTMSVTGTLDVPASPQEVLLPPQGGTAYVSCSASAQVAEVDLSSWTVRRLISAGRGADGLAWAPN